MKTSYQKLRKILRENNTGIFGAETNYRFVSIGKGDRYYHNYKYNIYNYDTHSFNESLKNDIFRAIVNKIIKDYEGGE